MRDQPETEATELAAEAAEGDTMPVRKDGGTTQRCGTIPVDLDNKLIVLAKLKDRTVSQCLKMAVKMWVEAEVEHYGADKVARLVKELENQQ